VDFRHCQLGICAAAILAGCGGTEWAVATPPLAPRTPSAMDVRADSKLSNEKLASERATSKCSGQSGTIDGSFSASGKARGPFPGRFAIRGAVKATLQTLRFRERFRITSGSRIISGEATIPSSPSGSPSFACSRSSTLSFVVPILSYRAKRPHATGRASATLAYGTFEQTFY
jgi:hypothetical protein